MVDTPVVENPPESGASKWGKLLAKYLFSHVGLCFLVIGYCVAGAFLFNHIEYDKEYEAKQTDRNVSIRIEHEREKLADDLWKYKWSQDYEIAVEKWIEEFHANLSDAIQNHGYAGEIIEQDSIEYGWSFASALLFTVTIVTTIGYGHVTPSTETGQITVIFYALLGLPLMLMFLANIGDAMANFFRLAYSRGCCFLCYRKRQKNYEYNRKRVGDAKSEPKSGWDDDDPSKKRPRSARSDSPSKKPDSARSRKSRRDSKSPNKRNNDEDDPEMEKSRPGTGRSKLEDDDLPESEQVNDNIDDAEKGVAGGNKDKPKEISKQEKEQELEDDLRQYDIKDLEEPAEEIVNVPISLTLVVIAAYVFIGAVLFAAWNDWSWIEGAYFSFVTLSTIGFGDYVPGWKELGTTIGNVKLAISAFYIVLGLAVLSMSFNLMMEEMIEKFKWLGRKLGIIDGDNPSKDPEKDPLLKNEQKPGKDTPRSKRRDSRDHSRSPSPNRPKSGSDRPKSGTSRPTSAVNDLPVEDVGEAAQVASNTGFV